MLKGNLHTWAGLGSKNALQKWVADEHYEKGGFPHTICEIKRTTKIKSHSR